MAIGAGLLVLILMVLGVRGCLDSRKESAMQDYVTDANALAEESNQVSDGLFELLEGADGASEVDIANALNGFRGLSAQQVDRARDLEAPDELKAAKDYLVETLDFRSDGIAAIADRLPATIAGDDQREGAATALAADMRPFLASDQIYLRRVTPSTEDALAGQGLELGVSESEFLKDVNWLDPVELATRIGGLGTGTDGEAAPGLHGNGLGAVTLGGLTLQPGTSVSMPVTEDLVFAVEVANQGENTEVDVTVRITVGSGSAAIEREKILDTIAAGEIKSVEVPLDEAPPTGQNVPVHVEIEPVSGEEKTDNNEGEYSIIFTS